MFEKNLKALSLQNPSLAIKLKEITFQNINAFESQSGDINISYNNIALHSEIDPIEEAQKLFTPKIQENLKNTFHILYGLGIGYLFKRAYISIVGKIIIFEPFLDILRFTFEYVDFSEELADRRVFLCTSIEEVITILNNKYLVGDKLELSYLPSYLTLNIALFNDLTNQTINLLENKKQDQNTLLTKAANWGVTTFDHLEELMNSIPADVLSDNFNDVPVVIVSAGPTLNENIELLKKYRKKYLLFTVNTALKTLLTNDIIPDFCTIAENFMIDKQFDELQNLDKVYYILHSRAQKYCWRLNEKNFIYLTETDGFANWYNKLLNNKYSLWPSAGSVSILAFYIAFKVLKAKKIILVGQDLAFIDNKMYSSESYNRNLDVITESNNLRVKVDGDGNQQNTYNIKLIKTKNIHGDEIITRIDYYNFIKQYEDILKNELPSNINVINTSLKGAYVEGMIYKTLLEVFDSVQIPDKSYSQLIDKIFSDNKFEIEHNKRISTPKIKEFIEELDKILSLTKKLIKIIEKFNLKYSKSPTNQSLQMLLSDFYQHKRFITEFISKEEVIFFIMQKDNLNYVNSFIMPTTNKPLTIFEHKLNLDNELKFLNNFAALLNVIKGFNYL